MQRKPFKKAARSLGLASLFKKLDADNREIRQVIAEMVEVYNKRSRVLQALTEILVDKGALTHAELSSKLGLIEKEADKHA